MQLISLFSGVGGFEYAAELIGWKVVSSCEINPFGRAVLNYYWPDAYHHDDVKTIDYKIINKLLNKNEPTILVAGFPCQPFSAAGKRLGTEDDRYGWPDCLRAIREVRPEWCLFENVRGLTNWNGGLVFDQVQADLENEGYQVTPFLLPACAVNAPHRRDRIWFIAYSETNRLQRSEGIDRRQECEPNNRGGIRNPFDTISKIRSSSNTDGMRRPQGYELQQPKLSEQLCKERDVTDTDNSGTGITMRNDGNGQTENQRWEGQSQPESGKIGSIAADTTNTGIEGMRPEWENEIHGSGNVTDSKDAGLSTRSVRPKKEQLGGRNITMGSRQWDGFPTQPPVRGRNDGLPSRLVGITFSKHRQESIKAYGNAVVPQVVLQIFKAIEKYNNL